MLNIAAAEGDKPWDFSEESILARSEDIAKFHGTRVVLIDPAPMGTTLNHDFWSNAVLQVHQEERVLRRVLLDGRHSQIWDVDKGINEALDLARYWNAHIIGVEEPPSARNAKFYKTRIEDIARKRGQRVEVIVFKTQQAKAQRIADLISMAKVGSFQVCRDTINCEFYDAFLFQGKNFPSPGHDDVIDSVAFINDTVLAELLPQSRFISSDNIFDREDEIANQYKSPFRWC
jgi:hypothetical protein